MGHWAVSLDPGGTTGYCLAFIGEPKVFQFSYAQHAWREEELWESLHKLHPDTLICESFEYRQGSRAGLDLTPVHLIGVVKLYAQTQGCKLVMQTASQGKAHFTDEWIKKRSVYNKSYRHGRDAFRHMMHWFMFGSGFQYNDDPELRIVEEQYLLDSYYREGVVL